MKLPVLSDDDLDVQIVLHRQIKGMIDIERCYINGKGEYWYNISGKQALDNFVKVYSFRYAFFEKLILRICEQLEILEWNLLDQNGLILDPEYIFLTNKEEDIFFMYYPHEKQNVMQEFQKLLEYLLTKLDHSEHEEVQGAYEIYEMTLCEDYNLQNIKQIILKERIRERVQEEILAEKGESEIEKEDIVKEEKNFSKFWEYLWKESFLQKMNGILGQIRNQFHHDGKDEVPMMVYPEEEKSQPVLHPTVCIASILKEPKGILMYEGKEGFSDITLNKEEMFIGKSPEASIEIQKETISNVHAKIVYREAYYIEDMNSTNGTFINEEILNYREQRVLKAGDIIRFADLTYRFL